MQLPARYRPVVVIAGVGCGLVLMSAFDGAGRPIGPVQPVEEMEGDTDDMDRRLADMGERMRVKDGYIRDLTDGRTTLGEVADKFREMNDETPGAANVLGHRHPGVPEREVSARTVWEFVRLQDLPTDRRRGVDDRLAAEYVKEFGHEWRPPADLPARSRGPWRPRWWSSRRPPPAGRPGATTDQSR